MSALRYSLLPCLLAVTLLGACGKKFSDDSKVLATVNGEAITEKDYDNYQQMRQGQQQRPPAADPEAERKLVLDELIDRVLITQRGAELGLEQSADVHFRMKRMRENLIAQELVRSTVKDAPITDEDVKKRFNEEVEKAHKTEYKARYLLVKTEDEAKDVAKKLKAGASFEQLARAKSLHTVSSKQGGDLGWVGQGALPPELFSIITPLKKGQVSDPVKSEFGWQIIKVEDTRPLKLPTFEEFTSDPRAPAGLRQRMQQERVQALLKELKGKAKITTN